VRSRGVLTVFVCLVAAAPVAAAEPGGGGGVCRAVGQAWDGRLEHGTALPDSGAGYARPATWRERGLGYGTDELVGAIQRAAATVEEKLPGSTLWVADLSYERGGPSAWHRSHENGLDADLIFYAVDEDGAPAPEPSAMRAFDDRLRAGRYRFDLERNWLLVRALLRDDQVRVERIFVHARIEKALLAFARERREPEWLIDLAAEMLQQSGGPHDDHFHVRIACPAGHGRCGEVIVKKKAKPKKKAHTGQKAKKAKKVKLATRTR
jgi:penicillin-insensitive murein endopeptidase